MPRVARPERHSDLTALIRRPCQGSALWRSVLGYIAVVKSGPPSAIEDEQPGQCSHDPARRTQPNWEIDELTADGPDSRSDQAQHHDRRPAHQIELHAAEQPDTTKPAPPWCRPILGISSFHLALAAAVDNRTDELELHAILSCRCGRVTAAGAVYGRPVTRRRWRLLSCR